MGYTLNHSCVHNERRVFSSILETEFVQIILHNSKRIAKIKMTNITCCLLSTSALIDLSVSKKSTNWVVECLVRRHQKKDSNKM